MEVDDSTSTTTANTASSTSLSDTKVIRNYHSELLKLNWMVKRGIILNTKFSKKNVKKRWVIFRIGPKATKEFTVVIGLEGQSLFFGVQIALVGQIFWGESVQNDKKALPYIFQIFLYWLERFSRQQTSIKLSMIWIQNNF